MCVCACALVRVCVCGWKMSFEGCTAACVGVGGRVPPLMGPTFSPAISAAAKKLSPCQINNKKLLTSFVKCFPTHARGLKPQREVAL